MNRPPYSKHMRGCFDCKTHTQLRCIECGRPVCGEHRHQYTKTCLDRHNEVQA